MSSKPPVEPTRLETLWEKAELTGFVKLFGEEPYYEERQRLRFDIAVLKGWTAWQLKEYDQALAAFLTALDVPEHLHPAKLRQWLLTHLLERRHDYAQPPINGRFPEYTLAPAGGDPSSLEEQRLTMPPGLEEASLSRTHPHGPCYKEITLAYLAFLHLLLLIDPQLFGRAAPVYFAYHARIEPLTGMVLLPIAPGTFLMGSPEDEAGRYSYEGPQHEVTLSRAFWLGRYPVTQAEYAKVMMGENHSRFKGENRPVESVSWEEAVEFCRRLTEHCRTAGTLPEGNEFRLPTEAEWEYCCRAGGTSAYCYGDDEARLADYAWYERNSKKETHEVGLKKANSWGLHDMHGNVWEWCLDAEEWSARYKDKESVVDPLSDSGQRRVNRGGSWHSTGRNCRSAFRFALVPALRHDGLGFRVCLAPSPAGRAG